MKPTHSAPKAEVISPAVTVESLWRSAAILVVLLLIVLSAQANSYPRLEAVFNIVGLATDPFDYVATDVRVKLVLPNGTTNSFPAFFDGGTTWRVRHTPLTNGTYSVVGVTLNGATISVTGLTPTSWNVTGPTYGAGYVRLDPTNPRRFITSNGRRHYPIGHNIAWWSSGDVGTNIAGAFAKMGAVGENWSRVWMDHFYGSKNLEWPKVGAFGTYDLNVARRWDTIVTGAEQSGIAFQLVIQHHGQYSTNVNPNWSGNPYNAANGGFLANTMQFFTDATAKSLTKRKLRYLIARWGYSPAILAWELFNEVQFTDAAQNGQWNIVIAWHDEMAAFLKAQDPWQHLVTTSSEVNQPMWGQCDYYQHHDYPSDLITGLRDAADVPGGQPVKPIFGGENGMESTPFWGAHAPLWAGLMAGQSGFSEQWYWDRVEAENAYSLFRPAAWFARAAGIGDQPTLARSSPTVTCPVINALAFAPGGGWATAAQDTFTVGGAAPDGVGALPSFLQGNYHRAMTPNGYTFNVNYAVAGTFAVQVTQIALSGASLAVIVDGVTNILAAFPAAGADYSTNYVGTVNLSPGTHTIRLVNTGLDWLVLGTITLNPYAPLLAAYQIGNTNFAAIWLWHRTNIYLSNPSTSLTGTVAVAGLNVGTYAAKWWDTVSGVTLSSFTFTVSNLNAPKVLNVPNVSRSIALYAGLPAQAAFDSPNLTQTVPPGSPAFSVPLIITNTGGLPLNYSLSLTGLNAVTHSSLNSTQAGGPVHLWRDISVIGTNVTGNFTPLAAPKTAKDEGSAGPYAIGFGFPFFSGDQSPGIYSNLYVSPNGFISFTPFTSDTSTNLALPVATNNSPANLAAWFWDDLDLATAGRVYVFSEPADGQCTVQFQNVTIKGTSAQVNGQIILKSTGEILLHYRALGQTNTSTVGVQNAARTAGLTVAHNQNYLRSYFSIRLSPTPWLTLSSPAGFVPRASRETINVVFDPAAVLPGYSRGTLLVTTDDPTSPLTVLPVSLNLRPAGAITNTVTSLADSGVGSLREAVAAAIAGDTINFAGALSGQTITLGGTQILLDKNLTIDGSALPGGITLSGNNASRVFEIATGTTNVLTALTMTNGSASAGGNSSADNGGGIYNSGTLTLNQCTLAGNSANYVGGGILNAGPLTLNQSTVAGNSASNAGGVYVAAPLTLNQSTVAGNSAVFAGGIYNGVGGIGSLTLFNSIVAGNSAPSFPEIFGPFSAIGVNLTNGDPRLAPLGNYGGPTPTLPPTPGSPAVDAAAASSLTTDQRGYARLTGLATDIGAVEGVFDPTIPLENPTRLGNGFFQFSFINLSGPSFTVLASTNVALLLNHWTVLGAPTEVLPGSGQYQFTDPQATNHPQRFYRVRSP